VPVNLAVTVALGTTAPDGSFIVPRISPLVWPQAAPDPNRLANTNRYTHAHAVRFIAAPLEKAGAAHSPQTPNFEFSVAAFEKTLL
jgi:hypothetical protein